MIYIDDLSKEKLKEIKKTLKKCDSLEIKYTIIRREMLKNKIKDTDYKEAYDRLITKIANFIKNDLETKNDPFSTITVFEYMLWNGIFSKDNKFQYSTSNRVNKLALLGADVMLGKSACLNNSVMLTDVLQNSNIESYTFECLDSIGEKNIDKKIDQFKKDVVEKNIILSLLLNDKMIRTMMKETGNHAINFFKVDDRYFLADPTNCYFLNIVDFLKAEVVGKSKKYYNLKLFNTPLVDSYINHKKLKELVLDSYLYSDENKSHLTIAFISELYQKSIAKCQKNKFLLDDFHNDNIKDIELICRKLKK